MMKSFQTIVLKFLTLQCIFFSSMSFALASLDKNFERVAIDVNTNHGSVRVNMNLMANNSWQAEITIEGPGALRFESEDLLGNLTFYGDTRPVDYIAEVFAEEILLPPTPGSYIIRFNDLTMAYGFERQFTTPMPYTRNFESLNLYAPNGNTPWPVVMDLVADHQWQTTVTLNGSEMIHFEVFFTTALMSFYGDTAPIDGIADELAEPIAMSTSQGNYVIRFNDQTLVYEIERQFDTPMPYTRNFESLNLYALNGSTPGPVAMDLVADHQWQATMTLNGPERFHFQAFFTTELMSFYGDTVPVDGIAEELAEPIAMSTSQGNYVIRFNDQTMAYSIAALADSIRVDIVSNQNTLSIGETLISTLTIENQMSFSVQKDIWLALQLPSGELYYYPGMTTSPTPLFNCAEIPTGVFLDNIEITNYSFAEGQQGVYHWYAIVVDCGVDFTTGIIDVDTVTVTSP